MELAQQLLADAYAADAEGDRLAVQPQGSVFVFGYTVDTIYEGHPNSSAAFQNNLKHLKWLDNRTNNDHLKSDGHIYFETWSGPHE
jgi:hypothetical protein